ncbi:MAG: cellulase, partial [Spirosoma sp.]|nr:cellulase [Spirosoma sp.]
MSNPTRLRFPYLLFIYLLMLTGMLANGQAPTGAIRLNQLGFYPNAPKIAVIAGETSASGHPGVFEVISSEAKQVLFRGTLSEARRNAVSGKTTQIADFSAFRQIGSFVMVVPGLGQSYPFDIRPAVYRDLAAGAIKGFYYQRVSTALSEPYAGAWSRPAGHADTRVLVHPSAASANRPAGTVLFSPRGWYDAGDYNKYIVNSGITVGTLLSLFEDYPEFCLKLPVSIPERTNSLPDLLDETLWNLRWMLTMQDPA